MKRIYLFFAMLVALLPFGLRAQDEVTVTFNLDIDNVEAVTVSVNYNPVEVKNGVNTFTVREYSNVNIAQKQGYKISVTDPDGYAVSIYGGSAGIYPSSSYAGKTWKVTSKKIEDDSQIIIGIDDPTRATLYMEERGELQLQPGDNVVKYSSEVNRNITINDYSGNIFAVKVDGQRIESNYGSYTIYLPTADRIDVQTIWPDIDCKVKFSFVTPGTENFISAVKVDDVEVPASEYMSDNFKVKAGKTVRFESTNYNTDYDVNSTQITVNGNTVYFYGDASFKVTGDTEVKIDARKLTKAKATVVLTGNPAGVRASINYNSVTLTEGVNTVEFVSSQNNLSLEPNSGYEITALTLNGTDKLNTGGIYLSEGDTVNVTVATKQYDQHVVVYMDRDPASFGYFNFFNYSNESQTLTKGYNTIGFAKSDAPFSISTYTTDGANEYYYLNGEKQERNPYSYAFYVQDGDVLKLFWGTEAPASYDVQLATEGSVEGVVVKYDRVKTLAMDGTASKHFAGTEFQVINGTNAAIKVMVNDAEVVAAEGAHTFTVNANTSVKISGPSGVENIAADSVANGNVYNMQGVKVGTADNMQQLPAGLYIVNGKKVAKK